MLSNEIIGSLAATLTTCAFIPQVVRIIQTRHTKDISLLMYLAFTLGVALWLAYGVLLNSWPIIVANGITLLLSSAVLFMKIRFG